MSQRPFAATTRHLVDALPKWGLPDFVCFCLTFKVLRVVALHLPGQSPRHIGRTIRSTMTAVS
jgi:hypothetical protein